MKIAEALGVNVFALYGDDTIEVLEAFTGETYPEKIMAANKRIAQSIQRDYHDNPIVQKAQQNLILSFNVHDGYTFSENEKNIVSSLAMLNDTGQQEALKRIQELTEIPRYQRTKAGEDPDA